MKKGTSSGGGGEVGSLQEKMLDNMDINFPCFKNNKHVYPDGGKILKPPKFGVLHFFQFFFHPLELYL